MQYVIAYKQGVIKFTLMMNGYFRIPKIKLKNAWFSGLTDPRSGPGTDILVL
jgi:hypothetical protein